MERRSTLSRRDGETLVEPPVDFHAGAYHTFLLIGTIDNPAVRLLTDGEA